MSKIRSALDIALERTESVESNPEKMREEKFTQEGQRLFSKYFFEKEKTLDDIKHDLSSTDEKERIYMIRGFTHTLLANLTLPANDLYVENLGAIKEAAAHLSREPEEVSKLFIQIDGFFQQYLQQSSQLRSSVEQQYAPKLRQKQQQLAKQFGSAVELTPDRDPEFIELLQRHQQDMDRQYQEIVEDIKEQILDLVTR